MLWFRALSNRKKTAPVKSRAKISILFAALEEADPDKEMEFFMDHAPGGPPGVSPGSLVELCKVKSSRAKATLSAEQTRE